MSFLLEVKNLSVELGGQKILENVSFALESGEILAVIGPNGAGKTTLVKAILNLIPHTGKVLFGGYPINNSFNAVGYVPQRFEFDRSLPISVKDFLSFYACGNNMNGVYFEKIYHQMDIFSLVNKLLGELSGGQLQKVLIGAAMLKKPSLLIMDEPTAGIDWGALGSFYGVVRYLNEAYKVAVILISHEINMIYSLAHQVICLNKKMFCSGIPKEVLNPENLSLIYDKEFKLKIKHKHIF